MPAVHAMQLVADVAPVPALYVPAGHAVGALIAVEDQVLPVVQVEHADVKEAPPAEKVPVEQGFTKPDACPAPHQ